MNQDILIGSHIGMSGPDYFKETVKTAIEYGENTFMFYTGAPQNSKRVPIEKCKIDEGIELIEKSNIDLSKVVVHAPYIINLANTDPEKHSFSVKLLVEELIRTAKFRCNVLVLHPGSTLGLDYNNSVDALVSGLDEALELANNDVVIALETMAGKGNEIGKTFEELQSIIKKCKFSNKLGVCFDTCHVNDAGYDLNDIDALLNKFDHIIGIDKLKVIHLNDSKNEKGSHKDRHENIGFGTIGFDTLLKYVFDERLINIPKILETPFINGFAPYKNEINMIKSKKFDKDIYTNL